MKIAYNPTTAAALTAAPQNNDITFDLKGVAIYAKGVKFKGTDTTYSVFKKHTSDNSGGYNGLVPVPSYNSNSKTRFLREDGTWVIPTNTTYAVVSSTANGLAPKIGTAAAATIATQADEWVLTSTKGGTPTWRKLPANAFKNDNTNTTYTLSGGLSSNNYIVTLTPSSGSATTATIPAMTGATSSAAGKAGLVPAPAANQHTLFLKGDGTWATPANTHYTTHLYIGAKDAASNAATTNGNTYIKVADNSTIRNQYIIKGSGNTSVSSDASGNITINSPTTISWGNVTDKPSSFTPATHYHSYLKGWSDTRAVATTPNDYNGYFKVVGIKTSGTTLGLNSTQAGSYATIIGWRGWTDKSGGYAWEIASTDKNRLYVRSGSETTWNNGWSAIAYMTDNYPTSQINKLTGYTIATSVAALATTDTLNVALGKLEYKLNIAYDLVTKANDGDGTIENLKEILDVLSGISDTETIKGIVGKYLPLAGGTMTLGEGLKFHADANYFGTNLDARIISLLDGNGTTCDGGLIIDERCTSNGTTTVTELLRIRDAEFKWKGQNILHSGNYSSYLGYIGTTAVQSTSAAQALTGITTATFSGAVTLSGTASNTAILKFSRSGASTWNYIIWPGDTNTDCKLAFGYSNSSSASYYYMTSASFNPVTNNVRSLGTSSVRWSNVYSVLGNFSGLITATSGVQIGSTADIGWYLYDNRICAGINAARDVNVGSLLVSNVWADSSKVPTNGIYSKGNVSAAGFVKSGSSNSYVLLGGGGHKAISDFMLKSEELTNNITTISKSLTVTQAWMDTGIKYQDLPATGTYIVQLTVSGTNNSTGNMYSCYWSGVMSWYRDGTNDSESDEILLHRSGHAYGNTLYLRTIMTASSDGRHLRLQIAANKDLGAAYTYTFKFKRII